ncbi:MAG: methylenetetrahydrofolate reductase [NAD(P)H] [Mariprofundaceae bacterium]|nr:methylenetetrahydrofolate reductase [NAD(P)H] [Mariprofundaceae bacterium]
MKLRDILKRDGIALSCEFFPPRTDKGEENLWNCIQELRVVNPAYVSVTYGAGGSTQDRTRRIVTRIKTETDLDPVAHLTCVGSTREQLGELLDEYKAAGIENILALRGDAPEGMDRFEAVAGGFSYATDLTRFIHERGGFSIGVASYPEGHPESKGGVADDVHYLKLKQDCGADAVITQYFFNNDDFFHFRDLAVNEGVTIPIIPGIMPIGNYDQIVRFSAMCGAKVPASIGERMIPHRDDADAMKEIGIEIATGQCADLIANGVNGLHIYSLNKSEATIAIHQNLGL